MAELDEDTTTKPGYSDTHTHVYVHKLRFLVLYIEVPKQHQYSVNHVLHLHAVPDMYHHVLNPVGHVPGQIQYLTTYTQCHAFICTGLLVVGLGIQAGRDQQGQEVHLHDNAGGLVPTPG